MKQYNFTPVLTLLTALLMLTSCQGDRRASKGAGTEAHPNIIFFVADDMWPEMFNLLPGSPGDYLTPNLDRLAEEGIIMMEQYVSTTVCNPSRFNCLTGKYASRAHNPSFLEDTEQNDGQTVVTFNAWIMEGDQNLARLMNELGYYTGATGKNHVINVPGWVQFPGTADTSDPSVMQELRRNHQRQIQAYLACGFDYADGLFRDNPYQNGPLSLARHNLDWLTRVALDFLDRAKDSTFFLYFASSVPHGPLDADRSWNADRRIVPYGLLEEAPRVLPARETIPRRLIEAGLATEGDIDDRKANMLWLDDALGALLEKLREIGAYENTIIIFFNDQGSPSKGTLYQGGTQSQTIIWRHGGFDTDPVIHTRVSNIDFAPTIYELAGGDPDGKSFDGKSFKAVLEGDTSRIHSSLYFELGYGRAVIKGKYKYLAVRYPGSAENIPLSQRKGWLDEVNESLRERGFEPRDIDPAKAFGHFSYNPGRQFSPNVIGRYPHFFDRDQLYDISTDPDEQDNLAREAGYQDVLEDMKSELKAWLEQLPGSFGEFKP